MVEGKNSKGALVIVLAVLCIVVIGISVFLALKPCNHQWNAATCDTPKTCLLCGTVAGTQLNHQWINATCSTPKTCLLCNSSIGEPLAHQWVDASCEAPKICSLCNVAEGEKGSHSWNTATCTLAATCSKCGMVAGNPIGHAWMDATDKKPKTCVLCGATEGTALQRDVVGVYRYDYLLNGTDHFDVFEFFTGGKVVFNYYIETRYGNDWVTINGTWSQSGNQITMVLERKENNVICYEFEGGKYDAFLTDEGIVWEAMLFKKVR